MNAFACRFGGPFTVCVLFALLLLGNSCGGSSQELLTAAALRADPAALQQNPAEAAAGLPALAALDKLNAASLAGPGWYPIDLNGPGLVSQSAQVTPAGAALDFDAQAGAAWKIWAVAGWDTDNAPTSLRCSVSGLSGEFYLGWADYVSGRWHIEGPFTADTVREFSPGDIHPDTSSYISPAGRLYLTVLAAPGSAFSLESLDLGVDGGDNAPAPVMNYYENSSSSAIIFTWIPSTSANDPDFAGYSIERRPLNGGDWQRVDGGLLSGTSFTDPDVLADHVYSYRANSWDVSGNMSLGLVDNFSADSGADASPVVIPVLPKGPLSGPAQVTIDLSGSYDPDGTAITNYAFDFGGVPETINTPDPVLNLTLQPGCYFLAFSATSNALTGYAYAFLKVYPQWQQAPVLVAESLPDANRVATPQVVVNPDGSSTVLFFDILQPGVSALTTGLDGQRSWDMLPLYGGNAGYISEPVQQNGKTVFLAIQASYTALLQWDGEQLDYLRASGLPNTSSNMDLAGNGSDSLFTLFWTFNGVDYDLRLGTVDPSVSEIIATNFPAAAPLDLEYDPQSKSLDIVVAGTSCTWFRRHPDGSIDTKLISPVATGSLDLDEDPATGRPAVIFWQATQYFYSALNDDLLSWSGPQIVDVLNTQKADGSLVHADGTSYIGATDLAGSIHLYRRDAGIWNIVNTDDGPAATGTVNLLRMPGSTGFRQVSSPFGGGLTIKDITLSDSETPVDSLPNVIGLGLQLGAGSSSSQLHVVETEQSAIGHYTSPDGMNWSVAPGIPGGSFAKTGRNAAGEFTVACNLAVNSVLYRWNGASFVSMTNLPRSANVIPILGSEPTFMFASADNSNAPPRLHYYTELNGASFSDNADMPIWDGHSVHTSNSHRMLAYFGGPSNTDSSLGLVDLTNNTVTELNMGSQSFAFDPYVRGRSMDGCPYMNSLFRQVGASWYATYGPAFVPVRITTNTFGSLDQTDLPFPLVLLEPGDIRHTVSACEMNGATAVGFISDNSGPNHYMEWSNFGDWEELSAPTQGLMSQGQLALGPDGRWHLFYRDIETDSVWVWSTL